MNRDILLKKIQDFYNNMSDEELRNKLETAGFEILNEKAGEISIEDYDYEEFSLPKTVTLNMGKKYKLSYSIENTWELANNSSLRNVG